MSAEKHDQHRNSVRDTYAQVANGQAGNDPASQGGGCCSPAPQASDSEQPAQGGCCVPGLMPEDATAVAKVLGYEADALALLPEGANMGLGCGNPVAIVALNPGETVIDLGSGGGIDCFLAAQAVGKDGYVIGVDMTPDMVSKARANASQSALSNIDFRLGEIEHLPVADNTADVILSNCVINLSPDKAQVLRDAFRTLKPGGRLSISDIVALKPMPDSLSKDAAAISGCIGNAAEIDTLKSLMADAGFVSVDITVKEGSRTFIQNWLPGSGAEDFVASATIQGTKPHT